MRTSLSIVFVSGIVAGVASLAACGSGKIETFSYEQAYEGHPGDFNRPTGGNEALVDKGGTTNSSSGSVSTPRGPKADDDTSGSSGSTGTGTTKGACSACGATYDCTVSGGGDTTQQTVTISAAVGNECAADLGVSITCDGKVMSAGEQVGNWAASGSTLVATVSASGTQSTYSCTKQ